MIEQVCTTDLESLKHTAYDFVFSQFCFTMSREIGKATCPYLAYFSLVGISLKVKAFGLIAMGTSDFSILLLGWA